MARKWTNAQERVTDPDDRWSLVYAMAFADEPIDNLNPPPTDHERKAYEEVRSDIKDGKKGVLMVPN